MKVRVLVVIALGICLATAHAANAASAPSLAIPFHRQERNGCGAASVAMVMDYWRMQSGRIDATAPAVAEVYAALYQQELNGIPLADMKRYLEGHGLRVFTLRGSLADLQQQLAKGRPVIAATRGSHRKPIHFVVVTGISSDSLWMNDPTKKRPRRMKLSTFEKHWGLADRWLLLAVAPARVQSSGAEAEPGHEPDRSLGETREDQGGLQ